jgi:protein-S-isoprenylcysteine O-methyltransferase Ste14
MSFGLVFAQFGLIAALVYQVYSAWPNVRLETPAAALLALSIAMALWTLTVNRPGNFNIIPEPKEQGQLVTDGPYQWIRHPMYTCVLLFCAACALMIDGWWAWYSWIVLFAVLWFKSVVEEHLLLQRYSEYAQYKSRTKRFVPFLV